MHPQTMRILHWHTKRRLDAKEDSSSLQRAKMTMNVGTGELFMRVVVGRLLTLQIPTSLLILNESRRGLSCLLSVKSYLY